MAPTLEEKLDDIIGKWESDDPGSTDIDAGPAAPEAPAEMTLPEVDLSSEPARLPPRDPIKSIKPQPATMGAGPGVLPRGGIGIRSDLSAKPMASPDSLDWKQLGDRLAKAHVTDDISRSAENYLSNAANSGQYHARAETGTNEALAKMPLQLAKERQGLERGQLANDAAKSKIGVAAAESDPSSLQSQKAREAFKTFLGDTVRTPAGFENWSAADLKHFASTGDMARILAAKNAAGDDARKLAADTEKAASKKTALENSRKALASELKAAGFDPTQASEEDIKRTLQMRGQNLTAEALRYREGEGEKKKGEDVPPGYEIVPGANPSSDSRKKFTDLVASQQKMKELTAAMRAELKGADIADRMMPGEKRRRLQQIATQMRIESKNVAQLGALSGPDMGLIEAIATDPTSIQSLAGGSIDSNLNGLDSWADSSVRAGERSYGLRRAGPQPGNGGTVRVRRKSDGVVAPVSKDVGARLISKGTYEPE